MIGSPKSDDGAEPLSSTVDDVRSVSLRRRDVLRAGLTGIGIGLAGCTGPSGRGSVSTERPYTEQLGECSPSGMYTDPPSGWPLPRFDPGATGHAPAGQAPVDFPLAVAWTFDRPARTPVIADGTAYVVPIRTSRLHALDASTGDEQWQVRVDGTIESGPVVHDDTVYIVVERDGAPVPVALESTTGAGRWTAEIRASAIDSLTVTDDVAFVSGRGPDPMLEAIDTDDGSLCWRFTPGGRSHGLAGVAVDAGVVCLAVHECGGDVCPADGSVYGLNPRTGDVRWRFDPQTEVNAPAIAGETVYASVDTAMFTLGKSTGDQRWTVGLGDEIEEAYPDRPPLFSGRPAVAHEFVYVSRISGDSGGLVEARDVTDGDRQWTFRLETAGDVVDLTSPAVAGEVVFVGAGSGAYAVDAGSGDRRWHTSTTGNVDAPAISNGRLFYGNTRGPVYAFE